MKKFIAGLLIVSLMWCIPSIGAPKVYATTTNYFSSSGDGHIYEDSSGSDQAAWDSAHDATSGGVTSYVGITSFAVAGQQATATTRIGRVFVPFDTSGIPDDAIINSATLYLYNTSMANLTVDAYSYVTIVQTDQASGTELVDADYNNCGATNNPTEGIDTDDRIFLADLVDDSYNAFPLNSTGIGWISKTGYTKLGVREGHDTTDNALLGGTNWNFAFFGMSENTTPELRPYLAITYNETPPEPVLSTFTPKIIFF